MGGIPPVDTNEIPKSILIEGLVILPLGMGKPQGYMGKRDTFLPHLTAVLGGKQGKHQRPVPSYATSGDGASARVGYRTTSNYCSKTVRKLNWFPDCIVSSLRIGNRLETVRQIFWEIDFEPGPSAAARDQLCGAVGAGTPEPAQAELVSTVHDRWRDPSLSPFENGHPA